MRDLIKFVAQYITEGENHDKMIQNLVNSASENLKIHDAHIANLEFASDGARMMSKHAEHTPEHKQGFDMLIHHLEQLHDPLDHDTAPNTHALDMLRVAKNTMHSTNRFTGEHNMTSMFLSDAADHLELAKHEATGNAAAFKKKAEYMDTAPREEIPDHIWSKHFNR